MPSDWLAELEEAHKAATPDPWTMEPGSTNAARGCATMEISARAHAFWIAHALAFPESKDPVYQANAELICATRNRLPDLLRIARLAKAVAGESWGTCTTEEHHCERMAKMDALRAVPKGGSYER
jgi:hypothetical protein